MYGTHEAVFGLWNSQKHVTFNTLNKCFPCASFSPALWCIYCLHHLWQMECSVFFYIAIGLWLNTHPLLCWNVLFIISAHVNIIGCLVNLLTLTTLYLSIIFFSQQQFEVKLLQPVLLWWPDLYPIQLFVADISKKCMTVQIVQFLLRLV